MDSEREPSVEAEAPDGAAYDNLPQQILNSLLEGFQVIGFDWTYLYVNEAAARQGRSTPASLRGRTMMEAYPGIETTQVFELVRECMVSRTAHSLENQFSYPDGSKRWFELRIEPAPEGVVIFSLDIEARRRAAQERARLEEQLRLAQKMDAIGRLAGGVAHDFNNLLAIILSYTECALDTAPSDLPLRNELLEIRSAATRAASLARQLLSVSRREVVEPVMLDLNALIRGMSSAARRVLGPAVTVDLQLAADLGPVRADPSQIERVLLNLLVNARDAMPGGGRLTIETSNVDLNSQSSHEGEVLAGPYVALKVSDTGAGMPPEVQARLFEPFFTTKPEGQGTGLGLAIVYGIVQQAGGQIWVYSEPGKGSTFRIYLPRQNGAASFVSRERRPLQVGGGESILVVEDCVAIRGVVGRTLSNGGYRVSLVESAEHALSFVEALDGPLHLLVTDVTLPGLSGPELAARILPRFPGLRVVYMSGYGEDRVVAHGAAGAVWRFVQKPFVTSELLAKVRDTLDAPTP
jgi:two-component system cell cycle sensor histidine kinase/response regulator CckA